jgi:hypothetical protein
MIRQKLDSEFSKTYWDNQQSQWGWDKIQKLADSKQDLATVNGFERLAMARKTYPAGVEFAAGAFEDLVKKVVESNNSQVAAAICRSETLNILLDYTLPRIAPSKLRRLAKDWEGPLLTEQKSGIGPKTIQAYWRQQDTFWAQSYIMDLERNKDPFLVEVLEFLAKSAPDKHWLKYLGDYPLYGLVRFTLVDQRDDIASAIVNSVVLFPLVDYYNPRNGQELLRELVRNKKVDVSNVYS